MRRPVAQHERHAIAFARRRTRPPWSCSRRAGAPACAAPPCRGPRWRAACRRQACAPTARSRHSRSAAPSRRTSRTRPRSPTTMRTQSGLRPRIGMKSISVTAPSSVSKRVSRISVSGAIAPRDASCLALRRDAEAAVSLARRAAPRSRHPIEARPAQPVDRAVARHQRGALAVADQRIVLDAAGAASVGELDDDLDVALPRSKASAKRASGTRRVIRRESQPGRRARAHRPPSVVAQVGVHGAEHDAVVSTRLRLNWPMSNSCLREAPTPVRQITRRARHAAARRR